MIVKQLIYRCWVALLVLPLLMSSCSADDEWNDIEQGMAVPEFSLPAADGSAVSSESLRGSIYLLTFFNTGCKDCQQELPVIQRLYDKYRYDISFVNVAREESAKDIDDYWKANGMTMPYYDHADKSLYHTFASNGIPRVYLVDNNGIVKAMFDDRNMPDFDTLSAAIEQCMDESGLFTDLIVKARVGNLQAMDDAPAASVSSSYNEYAINVLYGYFYDAETKKLVKVETMEGLTQVDDDPYAIYDVTYIARKLKLRNGRYDMFFVANTEFPPTEVETEDALLDYTDAQSYSTGVLPSVVDRGVIMSSIASDHVNFDLLDAKQKRATVNIKLERVMAKVQIGCDHSSFDLSHDGTTYATVNLTNYRLVNLNKKFYLFRHTQKGDDFQKPSRFLLAENFASDETGYTYVVDPYFYDKTPSQSGYDYMKGIYAVPYFSCDDYNMASLPSPPNKGRAYILENTSYKTSQKNAYSAGIVFKGAITPKSVWLLNPLTGELQENSNSEYWPMTLYFHKYKFYGSLNALKAGTGIDLTAASSYTDRELAQYGVKQVKYNMGVYETFYTYWIRHNAAAEGLAPMKYGIVRNNFYQLVVVGISGIGNSAIEPDLQRNNEPHSYDDSNVVL